MRPSTPLPSSAPHPATLIAGRRHTIVLQTSHVGWFISLVPGIVRTRHPHAHRQGRGEIARYLSHLYTWFNLCRWSERQLRTLSCPDSPYACHLQASSNTPSEPHVSSTCALTCTPSSPARRAGEAKTQVTEELKAKIRRAGGSG